MACKMVDCSSDSDVTEMIVLYLHENWRRKRKRRHNIGHTIFSRREQHLNEAADLSYKIGYFSTSNMRRSISGMSILVLATYNVE
jgi:hypothetical protein